MAADTPAPPQFRLLPARDPQILDFMTGIAVQLGFPAAAGSKLAALNVFHGPADLPCRLHATRFDKRVYVRPEVLLPLAADDLRADEFRRLLAAQAALLGQMGWLLGVSPEGLLQMTSLAWYDDADELLDALDQVHEVAPAIARSIPGQGRPQ